MIAKTLKRILKKVPLLLIAVLMAVVSDSPRTRVFFLEPSVVARWQISSPNNNHLGDVIKATLYITTQPGVVLDISQLPDEGQNLTLPSRLIDLSDKDPAYYLQYDTPPMVLEGELEVVSRRIFQRSQGGLVITEIAYEFMYLLPIDRSAPADDKRLPQYLPFYQKYRYVYVKTVKPDWRTSSIRIEMADFLIVPRVNKDSQPIFQFYRLTPPSSFWPYVRLAGWGLIGLALGLVVWRALIFMGAARRRDQVVDKTPKASELYDLWCENFDQAIFIEALKLYRRSVWGRPQASTWVKATFILYSGVSLSRDQIKTVFARLVEEVTHEHTS